MSELEFSSIKILIVDDDPLNLSMLEEELRDAGYETVTAMNGLDGLEALKEFDATLILLDLSMPEMTGYEATAAIRALDDKIVNNIPIVALTADVFQETKDRVMSSGFNNYVTKPFKSDVLYNTIVLHLGESRKWIAEQKAL